MKTPCFMDILYEVPVGGMQVKEEMKKENDASFGSITHTSQRICVSFNDCFPPFS